MILYIINKLEKGLLLVDKELLGYMKNVSDYYTKSSNFSANEIVELLLNSERSVAVENSESTSVHQTNEFYIDMDELSKWKNKNNSIFELHTYLPVTSHRKWISGFIIKTKKAIRKCLKWYIDPIAEQQNEFNGSVTASINAIYNNTIVMNEFMKKYANERREFTSQIEALKHQNNILNQRQEEALTKDDPILLTLKKELELLDDKVVVYQNVLVNQTSQYEALRTEIDELRCNENSSRMKFTSDLERVTNNLEEVKLDLEKNVAAQNYMSYKLNKIKKEGIKITLEKEQLPVETIKSDGFDYFAFENKFRGTEKQIKQNQNQYIKYFENKSNVLDIGCGRGEFLELLAKNNINCKGIDVYEEFTDYCLDKGLVVEKSDALDFIEKEKDNSLGGIFMGQVVEHLSEDYLFSLLEKCYEKMENGAYFVAETPNPTNLTTFTNSFYLDPSHIKPIHPESFKFMLEHVGFREVEVIFTETSKPTYKLPLINSAYVENLEEFNDGINCLSGILFGSLDYAIIARK